MKKVFIGVGHGGKDSGAVGYVIEKDVNLQIALACRDFLEKNGVQVKISRESDKYISLENKIKECNDWQADLAIDIHNNAGGGKGFEVFYFSGGGLSLDMAKNIENEVKSIGQNSRGCKIKLNDQKLDYFGFIRQTIAPAVIAEGAFVDNKEDAQMINTIEKQKTFGVAYAKGILKTLGINYNPVQTANEPKYYVQVGCYGLEENAKIQLKKAQDAGFTDAFIKRF